MRKATILLCTSLVCLSTMACKPEHAARGMMREQRMEQRGDRGADRGGERRGGLRRACSADIEQYCAADQKGRDRRECLQNHIDKLSADCKTALQDRMNRRGGGGRRNRDQTGTTNTTTPSGTNDKDDD